MTTATTSSAGSALSSLLSSTSSTSGATSTSSTDQSDRFLKLLVTQMQNQDPLNPMDNAQVTSQMAQISTVSGIGQLNTTITQMNSLMLQSQMMQGAALVGKSVLVAGNDLYPDASGKAGGGFDLGSAADSVTVTVSNAAGKVVDTINLGAQDAGRHGFDWTAPSGSSGGSYTFAVAAQSGTQSVSATTLGADVVSAVYTGSGSLAVELRDRGDVDFGSIKAVY